MVLSMFLNSSTQTPDVFSKFVEPLRTPLSQNSCARKCHGISDEDWVYTGIKRVLGEEQTGRGFLQKLFYSSNLSIEISHFFETLKSSRRFKYIRETLTALLTLVEERCSVEDPFAAYEDLQLFDIHAGDGHIHRASAHDEYKDGVKYAVQHFYFLNLRTRALNHLGLADTESDPSRKKGKRSLLSVYIKYIFI